MISRRSFVQQVGLTSALLGTGVPALAAEKPILGDDGLYHQSWFLDSFLELADDISETTGKGKNFAVFWELKGCPYCKETHFKNFARDDITGYVRKHFEILQLNVLGSRTVTDIDGTEMSEKALARKYGIRFSPTIQFFGSDVEKLKTLKPRKREVARAQGYLQPDDFLLMFKFVQTKAYETGSFRKFLKANRTT